jgi:DNA repair protein RecN (Recombination protein N)
MLLSLTIRDVVLIDRLDLVFSPHLSVLTGETGAGKSILLDALGLALGFRAESGMVRRGAAQAQVAAAFEIGRDHPAHAILAEQGFAAEDQLVLRRIVNADGRSRGFVNDQPASIGLMRQLGDTLVEIQGQFEQHGLLDPATHRGLLDAFAARPALVAAVRDGWGAWRKAHKARADAEALLAAARSEEEYLRHTLAELDAAAPQPGEEESLAERRALLLHGSQVSEATATAIQEIAGDRGGLRALANAARVLERVRDKAGHRLDAAIAALERALIETEETAALLEVAARDGEHGGDRLELVEERLFSLRALARKHQTSVEGLAALQQATAERLAAIDSGDAGLRALVVEESRCRGLFLDACRALSTVRAAAAERLDAAIQVELPPLKLERARFTTRLWSLPEADWGSAGAEEVAFLVATNPGAEPGPLGKIASGGELSRFLLALKLVLARLSSVPTIVFDEVDSGIGGAVAAAVGERLQRLGRELQVLVVTHSPQVAARGDCHFQVAKQVGGDTTTTQVAALNPAERQEEIARMLSGAEITAEARAAADRLLAAGLPAPAA